MNISNYFIQHIYPTLIYKNIPLNIVCEVNTKPYNKQSINFHKKYGFKEVGNKDINNEKSVIYMIYEN